MANAADTYSFDANNVFDNWDLNPLAQQVGGGADGVRDTLATKRDQYLQPYIQNYRKSGVKAPEDDYSLWQDSGFRSYVQNGQLPSQPNGGQQSVSAQWNSGGNAPQLAPAQENPRKNQLFDTLWARASQNPTPSANDPTIRAQADAYAANEERARRNYLDQAAEAGGPSINLRGEQRMAAERMGQRTGAFEANLLGQELKAKREEIAQALTQYGQQLSEEQRLALQERMANLDAALKQQGLSLQATGLNNDMQRALLQNDQFMRQLGLNEWDRATYYDALKSGYLG